jgi:hypothetical protein
MTLEHTIFNKIINDIEFKMMRKEEYCWIKIEPFNRTSIPSSIHIILNGEDHHWDIYDKNGEETNKVYFKGFNSTPSFYLKSGKKFYRFDCNLDNIKVLPITESHKMEDYLKDNCNCISPQASCWAVNIHYTSRPDKYPFNLM